MENYIFNGKIHYKSTIFNSYVKLPEGICSSLFILKYSLPKKKDKNLDPDDPVAIQEGNPD